MASASLPIAFTPRTIKGLGNTMWIDGGTGNPLYKIYNYSNDKQLWLLCITLPIGIDTIPVVPLIREPNIDTVYILCYNDALTSGGGTLPSYLNYLKLLKNALATIDDMRVDLFDGGNCYYYYFVCFYLSPLWSRGSTNILTLTRMFSIYLSIYLLFLLLAMDVAIKSNTTSFSYIPVLNTTVSNRYQIFHISTNVVYFQF